MSDVHVHLRNHWTAATGAVDFAARVANSHRGERVGPDLADVAAQVSEDRRSLREVMRAVDARTGVALPLAARVGERIGRLKPNGHLLTRSPVTDVLELEALRGATCLKGAGWDTLLAFAPAEPRLPVALIERLRARADEQGRILSRVQVQLAAGWGSPPAR